MARDHCRCNSTEMTPGCRLAAADVLLYDWPLKSFVLKTAATNLVTSLRSTGEEPKPSRRSSIVASCDSSEAKLGFRSMTFWLFIDAEFRACWRLGNRCDVLDSGCGVARRLSFLLSKAPVDCMKERVSNSLLTCGCMCVVLRLRANCLPDLKGEMGRWSWREEHQVLPCAEYMDYHVVFSTGTCINIRYLAFSRGGIRINVKQTCCCPVTVAGRPDWI